MMYGRHLPPPQGTSPTAEKILRSLFKRKKKQFKSTNILSYWRMSTAKINQHLCESKSGNSRTVLLTQFKPRFRPRNYVGKHKTNLATIKDIISGNQVKTHFPCRRSSG